VTELLRFPPTCHPSLRFSAGVIARGTTREQDIGVSN
jgi:hypothetical protein